LTAGRDYRHASQAEGFLEALPAIVAETAASCDVALFQAGADPHVDDPLGGWLTTEQLRQRDAIVFDELKRLGVAVVFCLAGGYQVEPDSSIPRVLEIHDNTMRECIRVFAPGTAGAPFVPGARSGWRRYCRHHTVKRRSGRPDDEPIERLPPGRSCGTRGNGRTPPSASDGSRLGVARA
jgi:hypothetical protein